MAGVGGFFLKGLAGGIQSGFEMGWKKKQQKKLEEKQAKLMESAGVYNNLVKQLGEDKAYSDDDIMKLDTCFLSLGYEVQAMVKDSHNAIMTMDKNKFEQDIAWFDTTIEWIEGGQLDPKDATEIFNFVRDNYATTDKGKGLFTAYDGLYEKKYKAPTEDVWGQAGKLPMDIRDEYLRSKGVDIPQPPEAPAKLTGIPAEIAEIDKMTWLTEERRNKMKVDRLTKADSATAEKVKAIYAAGGKDVDVVKALGGGVIGPEPTTTDKSRATSLTTLEKSRENALNADSWEDAESIIKDYTEAGYDEKQLGITKQDWANVKKSDLDNLAAVLNDITAGTPEGRNVKGKKKFTFEINGDVTEKTGEEWYKAVYESYIALLKLLEETGVDISQYKKLKPLSEIKKIKFGGFVGSGVETGDLTFIYY